MGLEIGEARGLASAREKSCPQLQQSKLYFVMDAEIIIIITIQAANRYNMFGPSCSKIVSTRKSMIERLDKLIIKTDDSNLLDVRYGTTDISFLHFSFNQDKRLETLNQG